MTNSNLAQRSAIVLVTRLSVALINFISFYFIAQYMGPEPLGLIGFANGFVGVFSFLQDPGLNDANGKLLGEGKNVGRRIGAYLLLKAVLGVMVPIAVIGAVQVAKRMPGEAFADPHTEAIVYIVLTGTLFMLFQSCVYSTLAGLQMTARQEVPNYWGLTDAPLRILVALRNLGALPLALANLAGNLSSALAAAWMLRTIPIERPTRVELSAYVRFARPIALAGLVSVLAANLDKVIIQWYQGPVEVGYLYSAERILTLLGMISISAMVVLFPRLSLHHSRGDLHAASNLTSRATRHIGLIITPIIALFIVFNIQVTELLLGRAFLPATPVLIVACLSIWLLSLSRPISYLLVATANQGPFSAARMATSLAATMLGLVLIPTSAFGVRLAGLGALGAALATFLSQLLLLGLLMFFAARRIGYRLPTDPLKQIAAGVVMGSVIWSIGRVFPDGQSPSVSIVSALVGFLVYPIVLYILGGLSREDILLYWRAGNIITAYRYVRSEISSQNRSTGCDAILPKTE